MTRPFDRLWGRFRVSTRIGAAIVLALVTIQAFAVLHFLLLPEPRWTVYGLRWLTNASSEAVAAVFAHPEPQRNDVLRGLPAAQWLNITWQRHAAAVATEPRSHPPSTHHERFGDLIAGSLHHSLKGDVKAVRVSLGPRGPGPGPPAPPSRGRITFVPPELGASATEAWDLNPDASRTQLLAPIGDQIPGIVDSGREVLIPGLFRIEIQGADNTWITLSPRDQTGWQLLYWPLLPLIGGTLVVVLLSLFTARRIVAPLEHLTHAARRLGVERELAPISTRGLGEFSAIAEAFNEMQARLKRFVDERTQMLAAISHDLRTSLTRLRLEVEGLSADKPRRALAQEINEMEAMISATLSFASGDAKRESSRSIDLAALLISLCDKIGDEGADVRYQGPDHARFCCQPLLMKRAFTNIIDNAVKYGQRVTVELAMAEQAAVVQISDEGPGIPPEQQLEAFAPFRRLEGSRNRATGGVGLGLTIARDAIHAHGGTIALVNGNPYGLVVTMHLPLAAG